MNLDRVIAVRNAKTVYRDGDRCIKVFNDKYTKADVLNEALNQARVEETGLNIPKILEVTQVGDKWAIVLEYITGKTMDRLMKEESDKKAEYMERFVDLQISVFEKRCPKLSKLRDKLGGNILFSELDATTRVDLHARLDSMPRNNELCHGDFNPSNIIIREDGTPFILDWSHATVGNREADVARTFLYFYLNGEKESAKAYLEMFCNKSGSSKEDIKKWMPIVAASLSVKGNEREREFLLSWENIVDYE